MNMYAWIGVVLAVAAIVGIVVYMVTQRSPVAVAAEAAGSAVGAAVKLAGNAAKATTTAYADLDRDFGPAEMTFDPRATGGIEA